MKVVFERGAERDLQESLRWYRKRSDQAANNFITEVQSAVYSLSSDPFKNRQVAPDVRAIKFKRYPYCLIYKIIDETVRIYAAAHEKRRTGYWKRRLN